MKTKTFDSVAMKNSIQARHRRARKGLTDEQVRQQVAERLATSDDIVARKWRRIAGSEADTQDGS